MKKSFSIAIAEPCSQNWQNFTPTEKGGFCAACSKEVTDFTILSDSEIIQFFQDRPKNTCGKFRPEQLTHYRVIEQSQINTGWKLWRAGLLAITLAIISKPATAQSRDQKERTEQHESNVALHKNVDPKYLKVSGRIIHAEDSSAVPGVNIVKVGSTIGAVSDADGRFIFPEPLTQGDLLIFSFIGLKSITIPISSQTRELTVIMENDSVMLGGVMAGGVQITNRISFRRWWWKLKNVF